MRDWACLHTHSHYSLLDGLSKPKAIAARALKLGLKAVALTDHGNISGIPDIAQEMDAVGIKWIAGNEFYICEQDCKIKTKENRKLSHLLVLAKNKQGWVDLLKATSASNHPDISYYKPRLDIATLAKYCSGNWIIITGHPGSTIANLAFGRNGTAYRSSSIDQARSFITDASKEEVMNTIGYYQELFGKPNVKIESQLVDLENMAAAGALTEFYRGELSQKIAFDKIATADAHYPERQDAIDQRLLLCKNMGKTFKQVQYASDEGEEFGLMGFFKSNNYHIPSLEEINEIHKDHPQELEACLAIADECENYSIFDAPKFPVFDCPNGQEQNEYFKQLCENGLAKMNLSTEKYDTYRTRMETELKVFTEANLAGYFLVVRDYVMWAKSKGAMVNLRGSGTGCLVCRLIDISSVDPIPYGLIFERFYNAGRNTATRVALPDLDMDFPGSIRDKVFDYCCKKYGDDKVCQMITFHRMQGRGALKDIYRINGVCSPDDANKITRNIPDEAAISDQLQLMKEAGKEPSILMWVLENTPDVISDVCKLEADGTLSGDHARWFAQAIRLEGTKHNKGKHAAGMIISQEPLENICPMVYDETTGRRIAGLEMEALEKMGHIKFDVLTVSTLDRIMEVNTLLEEEYDSQA